MIRKKLRRKKIREDILTVLHVHWNLKCGKIAIKGCYLKAIKNSEATEVASLQTCSFILRVLNR
ncbi:hypothetical protein SPHINGO8BC_51607 [Sphingobacterium multivorum]|uniref:Uncharacterized protein n=1 Tax=Sphingobacterium multivorum TaxID=28454 RepID=A0A654D4N0_SPHMU|nr:hypothetical protein SPHINGO8BC_51607 [Sphingobacterium multivorum]